MRGSHPTGMKRKHQSETPPPRAAVNVRSRLAKGWAWLALVGVLLFTTGVRLRLDSIPLERDEGEYAYAGQLILQGEPAYASAYNMKLPGTYIAYAGILAIFGETAEGVHRGLLVVNLATIVLVFLLARKLVGESAAVVAAGSYAVLSISPAVLGFAGHATHFVVLPVLGGLLLLVGIEAPGRLRTALAGVLFGLGFLMKQPGALFLPLGAGLALWHGARGASPRWRGALWHGLAFVGGAVLPYALICAWLLAAGVFDRFWFWTVVYAREYASLLTLTEGVSVFRTMIGRVISHGAPIWALAAVGLSALAWHRALRPRAAILIGWLVVSFLAVCPGLYFRSHYFIVMLPVIAVLAGAAVQALGTGLTRWVRPGAAAVVAGFLATACVAWPVWAQRSFLFILEPGLASRAVYGINPFPESPAIADYIRTHSAPDATLAVIGSEPQLYFLAQRRSATGHIYTYGMMEPHAFAAEMQREMIREITAAKPQYLVFVGVTTSWLLRPDSPRDIFRWFQDYTRKDYTLVGLVDIAPAGRSMYFWDDDVRWHPDINACEIHVWRRRDGG